MIFQSQEWRAVETHMPLVCAEVKSLRALVANSALDVHWLICWAEAAKKMIERSMQPKEEMCPDFYYQKNFTPIKWSK
jgi:hypothetical protein